MEPTTWDMAVMERHGENLPVGPLTEKQTADQDAYRAYCEEREAEYQAQQRAGGRTVCPQCGQRTVVHRSVCTLGHPGHPGAEFSDYAKCENCDYKEL